MIGEKKLEIRAPSANKLLDQRPVSNDPMQAFRLYQNRPQSVNQNIGVAKSNSEREIVQNEKQKELQQERANLFRNFGKNEENKPPVSRNNLDKFLGKEPEVKKDKPQVLLGKEIFVRVYPYQKIKWQQRINTQ